MKPGTDSLFPLSVDTDSLFEKLFSVFPSKRRGTRRLAYPAWKKAIKRESPEVILAGAIAYAESDPGEYSKGLAAWLNSDCWAIEYAPSTQKKTTPDKAVTKARYFDLRARYKKPYHDWMNESEITEMRKYEKEMTA